MANTKDLDYTALIGVGVVMVFAGMAVGTFFIAPKLQKRKAKKLAEAKAKSLNTTKKS